MTTPTEIKEWIEQGLSCEHITVEGDGRHFDAIVVSAQFSDKSMLERHRMVYDALGERMESDIHALSFKTFTPEEHNPA